MTKAAPPSPHRPGRAVAKVYAFASVDYPGAALSFVFDSDGTTAVGAFVFDPGSTTSPTTAFTFAGGVYQVLAVPSSTESIATGINGAGLIVGLYRDLAGLRRGFADNGGAFTAIDFPGATGTAAAGINAAGDVVGLWSDATASHGFLLQAGVFTPINFPLATNTTAIGISDTGEIAGFYDDAGGDAHGFIYASGAFSTVDVA